MDAIGTIVGGVLLALSAIGQFFSAQQKRQRAAMRREVERMTAALDVADKREAAALTWAGLALDRVCESVAGRQQHNVAFHATDGHPIDVPDIPPELTGGMRAFINEHAPRLVEADDE